MRTGDGLDVRRRKLLYRCWHRGTREMDLVMGLFADQCIADLNERALAELEQLSDQPDPDILAWVLEERPVPPNFDTETFRALQRFQYRRRDPT